MLREGGILRNNPMYFLCMVIFPVFVVIFFTTMMDEGQPQELPVGVVDLDNSSTTRTLIRKLNDFQTSNVVAHYHSVSEAREAIQHNEIYAFLYIPKGTTAKMLASRQPKISFYYSSTSLAAGSLLFRDLKTISTLGSAGVGQATMRAKGVPQTMIMPLLQPITVDAHPLNNPWVNYNQYLSTMLIPATLLLFIMLLTAYSLGSEIKTQRGKELMERAGGNILIAVAGKLLPQTLVFVSLMYFHLFYLFVALGFVHLGGLGWILLLGLLAVLAAQGFGLMIFSLMPSMRLSMSICSLWGVLSYSMVGAAFPAFAMDAPLEALTFLFPMRHYWLIYAMNVFNGYPLSDTWINVSALMIFAALPLLFLSRAKKAFNTYIYVK